MRNHKYQVFMWSIVFKILDVLVCENAMTNLKNYLGCCNNKYEKCKEKFNVIC